jgi:hypothetical protein
MNQHEGPVSPGGVGLARHEVCDLHGEVDRSDHGDVLASLLVNFLAIVVAVGLVSVAGGGLADGHHLGVALPDVGNSDGPGGGGLSLLGVGGEGDLGGGQGAGEEGSEAEGLHDGALLEGADRMMCDGDRAVSKFFFSLFFCLLLYNLCYAILYYTFKTDNG